MITKKQVTKLRDLKKNDSIYILDLSNIEEGFKKYKVIKNIHHKPDPLEEYWASCGNEDNIEYWTIHFNSPYLDRFINVEFMDESVIFNFTYAWKEDEITRSKQVHLIVSVSPQAGYEFTLNKLNEHKRNVKQLIADRVKLIEHYENEINKYKFDVTQFDQQIDALNNLNIE